MPLQAFLAAVLAFLAGLLTIVVPLEAGSTSAEVAVQWVLFWLVLGGLAVGVGRRLDEPILRAFPMVPVTVLLVATAFAQPGTILALGRMRIPLAAPVATALGVSVGIAAWYVGLRLARRLPR